MRCFKIDVRVYIRICGKEFDMFLFHVVFFTFVVQICLFGLFSFVVQIYFFGLFSFDCLFVLF